MYSQNSIELLKNRIGYGRSYSLPFQLEDNLASGTSGRLFSFFHSLVTPANLYAVVEVPQMKEADFNELLDQIRKDAVLACLNNVLEKSKDYIPDYDYDALIAERPHLFDDVIGYTVTIKCVEMMITTSRENLEKRSAAFAYSKLKMDIEGAKDDQGRTLARGMTAKLFSAVKLAQGIIFPKEIIVKAENNYW